VDLGYARRAFKLKPLHKKPTGSADIHWDDVIGMEEAKQEAGEVVKLITDRAKVKAIGGKILRGILMMGPPGCVKLILLKRLPPKQNCRF